MKRTKPIIEGFDNIASQIFTADNFSNTLSDWFNKLKNIPLDQSAGSSYGAVFITLAYLLFHKVQIKRNHRGSTCKNKREKI